MKKSIAKNIKSSANLSAPSFFNKNKNEVFLAKGIEQKQSFFKPATVQNIKPAASAPVIQRKFAGTDGKKVDMSEKDGQILIESKNASNDLTRLIKLVNESGSHTAVMQVLKTSNNSSNIHVKIKKRRVNNRLYGLHQAHNSKGKALNWNRKKGDFDGVPEYVGGTNGGAVYKEATITIFEGNLRKGGGNDSSHNSAGIKLSLEQLIAGTFAHETGHNTDKEFIEDLRKRREGKANENIDAHKNIDPLDDQVYQEIGEHQRAADKKKKEEEEAVTK